MDIIINIIDISFIIPAENFNRSLKIDIKIKYI